MRISLLRRGAGTSNAAREIAKPCSLTFYSGFIDKVRGDTKPERRKLATLDGSLMFRGTGPVFITTKADDGGGAPMEYDAEAGVGDPHRGDPRVAPEEDETAPKETLPRVLSLEFDPASFEGVKDLEGENDRLLVPPEPDRIFHLELFAELTVDGDAEASIDVNDVLDVYLTEDCPPRNDGLRLTLTSMDDVPVPSADFSVRFENGLELDGTLNKDGCVRILDAPSGLFEVTYTDLDDVRAKILAARAHDALKKRDIAGVLGVLGQSTTLLAKIQTAYQTFYDDLSGEGLVGDARSLTKGTQDELPSEHLITLGKLEGAEPTQIVAMNESSLDGPADGDTAVA